MANYKPVEMKHPLDFIATLDPDQAREQNIFQLMQLSKHGVAWATFLKLQKQVDFSLQEWSSFLQLSPRTLQRMQKHQRPFDHLQSERIIMIALLLIKGKELFGDLQKFSLWLNADNLALGGIKPKSILDSAFGIEMVRSELIRIEHGVLA